MANKKVVVLLVLAALAMAATPMHADAQLLPCPKECGKDNDNMECPNNLCCSKDGFCGLGNKYCSTGCQSGACSESMRCGWQNSNATCPNNQCCSWDGYCGLGDWFCRNDKCQSGPCHYDIKCGQLLPDPNPYGIRMECPNNLCCNKDGFCGLGEEYCSNSTQVGCQSGACYDDKITIGKQRCGKRDIPNGSPGNGKTCLNKRCCSYAGFCGTNGQYCTGGCQKDYGTCYTSVLGSFISLDALLGCTRP
ncbi:agglutinin isolectin 3 [Brachypodium distachyon]|uniref:Chitin-binding type-1 domain-containing protein n=1 Tax=Brachypodium distachyon TaxID=15368 RepID=A0A2K2CLM4_BRADI|nr:agglutinin isolectin 3 [Brachypodium distachyon]PNT62930.1 hypothetical protein BRADI_4g09690v3 [Brachypodium distachyon]|eukprot:XP_003575652.3 agglutinin isolectin 3 [Brachypodium distachyon]